MHTKLGSVEIYYNALEDSLKMYNGKHYYPFDAFKEEILGRLTVDEFGGRCGNVRINEEFIEGLKDGLFYGAITQWYLIWINLSLAGAILVLFCCYQTITRTKKYIPVLKKSGNGSSQDSEKQEEDGYQPNKSYYTDGNVTDRKSTMPNIMTTERNETEPDLDNTGELGGFGRKDPGPKASPRYAPDYDPPSRR